MKTLETGVYSSGVVCAFIGSVATALVRPKGVLKDINTLWTTNPQVYVIVVVVCIVLSAATMYIMARISRSQPPMMRLLFKTFVLALLAFSLGTMVLMTLGFVGVCAVLQPAPIAIWSAVSYLSGGLAGLAAMRSVPEYRRILGRKE